MGKCNCKARKRDEIMCCERTLVSDGVSATKAIRFVNLEQRYPDECPYRDVVLF